MVKDTWRHHVRLHSRSHVLALRLPELKKSEKRRKKSQCCNSDARWQSRSLRDPRAFPRQDVYRRQRGQQHGYKQPGSLVECRWRRQYACSPNGYPTSNVCVAV